MAGKVHVLMVGVGILMMTAAGGIVLQAVNQPPGGSARDAAPTPAPETGGNAGVLATTDPPPTPTPTAATPTPTPRPTTTRRPTTTAPRPTTAAPTVTTTTTAPPAWRLVWSDEFSGAALDAAKWNARDSTTVDLAPACVTARPENLSVSSGLLTMTARQEDLVCGAQTRPYTVSYLDTQGTGSFTRGAFEVRLTSPNGPDTSVGLRPVVGLRPDDGGAGQLEVVELPGGPAAYNTATQRIVGDTTAEQSYPFPAGSPADGFHVYRTEWEPGLIRWLVDGVEVFRRDLTTAPWLDSVFGRAYHLRLAFELDSPHASTTFPANLQIDYVRVYQR